MATADALKPKHGMPSEIVSVSRVQRPKFYWACIKELEHQTGESQAHLRTLNSWNFPRAVVDAAPRHLRPTKRGKANG